MPVAAASRQTKTAIEAVGGFGQIAERAQIADAQEPQQPDDAPRHTVLAGVPVLDGAQRHAEVRGARFAVEQARMA